MILSFDANPIIVGRNYHTKWQRNKGMRFVLYEVNGSKARLKTRCTNKDFWTNTEDLIFIRTNYNMQKAIRILNHKKEIKKDENIN